MKKFSKVLLTLLFTGTVFSASAVNMSMIITPNNTPLASQGVYFYIGPSPYILYSTSTDSRGNFTVPDEYEGMSIQCNFGWARCNPVTVKEGAVMAIYA